MRYRIPPTAFCLAAFRKVAAVLGCLRFGEGGSVGDVRRWENHDDIREEMSCCGGGCDARDGCGSCRVDRDGTEALIDV